MVRRALAGAAAVLALASSLGAGTACGQYFGGSLPNHGHSSTTGDGGPTLTPQGVTASTITAVSSFTVLSNGRIAGNLEVGGTLSVTGSLSIPRVQSSTGAITEGTAFVGTTSDGACMATSTRTIVLPRQMDVEVSLAGSQTQTTASRFWASFLLNGAYVAPLTNAKAATEFLSNGLGFGPANFSWIIPNLAAGTHRVCLLLWTTGGTGTLLNGTANSNQFSVKPLQ